jgi:hypothetical protein
VQKKLGLTLKERRPQEDLMLSHNFVGGSITDGDHLLRKADGLERIRTRQATDPNSPVAQYARNDTRKLSFGVRAVEPWNKLAPDTQKFTKKGKFTAKIKATRNNDQWLINNNRWLYRTEKRPIDNWCQGGRLRRELEQSKRRTSHPHDTRES